MKTIDPTKPAKSDIEISGAIRGGVLLVDDKRWFLDALTRLPDGPIVLRIDRAGDLRARAANGHYWGVLRDIATQRNEHEATGVHTTQTLHDFYKALFNGGASTTGLAPDQFSIYVERVMAHAATEHGVEFREPEPLV